ncbi:bromodomain-containing protein 4-like [Bufo gargarizans]|uniref:bromodomain-containing protein 4-like n=1 Tax=Bufo gargarizans TaxID=30331 RepID=UPI001CF0D8E1|nr:bromodomain-containing protein 4-like [Bufo gargarizans]
MDVEKLIVLVQDRPCLWDLRCSEYQDRYKKDAAWEEVTQDLFAAIWQTTKGQSRRNLIEEVKNRWRSCRDQFRKEMRKQGRSGAGLPKKRPYLFREQLMFLRAVMDLRPTEDNLEEDEEESAPQLSSACDEEPTAGQQESLPGPTPGPSEPPAASGADSPPLPLALPIRSRRRANPPAESNVNVQVLDYLSRARQEDHHDMFARSLAHYMRQLPPERLLRTRTSVEIVLELANSLPDPSMMHDALENLRRYGQLIVPKHPTVSQPFPDQPQMPPPRDHYGPPMAPYVPQIQGEPSYGPPGPSPSRAGPPSQAQYSRAPSQGQYSCAYSTATTWGANGDSDRMSKSAS